jgi:VWFA-related protein
MTLRPLYLTTLLALSLAASVPRAQEPQRGPGVLTEGVTAVLVDVVVRDRRGQPVRDLSPGDFEVVEDGVPQTVGSFTAIFDGSTRPAAQAPAAARPAGTAAATPAGPEVDPGVVVTALVFDRLSPEARRLSVQAAQTYVGTSEQTPHYVGLYGVDLALTPYTPFTRNAPVLRKGLQTLAVGSSSAFKQQALQERRADAERRAGTVGDASATPPVAGGQAGGAAAAGAAAAGVEAMLAQMEARMLREFDQMEREQQGYSTTNGLLSVINALGQLPGRKSLVLFSESVAIPSAVHRLFLGVIDAANRANVSIYAVDAAGLRTGSEQARIRDEVNRTGSRGINTGYTGDSAGGPLTKALEDTAEALRSDPEGALGQLAQYTGGLLINNTNNLRQGLTRIDDDQRNYYLLGYTPANQQHDGRFRTIDVRVKRPGVTVAARKGYFAVRDTGGRPVNAWEAPALGALEQKPVPNAFPLRAGALRFPERGRPGLTPVLVDFLTQSVTFKPAGDGTTYTSDFAVLVRFVDDRNQVVRRVSQHYEVNGPIDQLDGAKRGQVIFYQEPELPTGIYTMETVVYDALADRASVRFSTVEVPQLPDGTLRMSSLVLVGGADEVPQAERRAENPLQVNDVVLRPNLGEPIPRTSKEAVFYFAVYPAPGSDRPHAMIEVLQNGRRVAEVPMLVAEPDASGRVQQLGRLPIAGLVPATYELVVTVKQGDEHVSQSTMFRIVD